MTYGFSPESQYRLMSYEPSPEGTTCVLANGKDRDTLRLRVPGRHNVLNAVAAIAVADELSVPRKVALESLGEFQGVQRRFQKRGVLNGVQLIDDYAHHPTEIRATLAAARERYPFSKIRVVFQPHRFSRVDDLLEQFTTCFQEADGVAITNIYAAGEMQIPGVTSELMVEMMQRQAGASGIKLNSFQHVTSAMDGVESLLSKSVSGDIILTMGAGDLPNVYKQLF